MPMLEGKVAVITGAGRGIGRAIAIQMAEEGAEVVANDPGVGPDGAGHDDGPADQVVAEIATKGLTAVASYDSVATMAGGEAIIQTALDSFGRIDVLVNNAAVQGPIGPLAETPAAEWIRAVEINLLGTFLVTRAVLPHMLARGRG
ncbi:MAG: SDR family NAD(P)-dependent oxidoreductase, partial [Dehalococcoidia bacterium]|nr:SDR family NAD(P)-dependent oxidoreductase [Dehalococcoidia bacterium]